MIALADERVGNLEQNAAYDYTSTVSSKEAIFHSDWVGAVDAQSGPVAGAEVDARIALAQVGASKWVRPL